MNAPELVFRANARRLVPGVNVPVAAPSCALLWTSAASCLSVRPRAGGKSPAFGRSAAGSSLTAGGGPAVVRAVLAVVVLECVFLELEDPQPVVARAAAAATRASSRRNAICLLMC